MNTENGNTLKYRVEQVEKCCDSNRKALELIKFVSEYKQDIKDLNIMQNDIHSIKQTLIEKKESDKWVMRLLIGALVTGILTPVAIKFLGF